MNEPRVCFVVSEIEPTVYNVSERYGINCRIFKMLRDAPLTRELQAPASAISFFGYLALIP